MATKKHLGFRQHTSPPLGSLSMSQPRFKQNMQNPLHGIGQIFNGFTTFFSNFILKNPIFFPCPPAMANSNEPKTWDSHDLPANIMVKLHKLSGFKNYKVSNVTFVNPRTRSKVDSADESFRDLLELKPGGVYTKQQFVQQVKDLSNAQCFEKIDLDVKTNPDGSLDVNLPFKEIIHPTKSRVRCVNIGSIPQNEIEVDPDKVKDMTMKEQFELERKLLQQNRKRIEGGKECLISEEVDKEIDRMLSESTNGTSAGLLRRIGRRICKWYEDNGYYYAQVVNFSAGTGKEIVFEVVEGEISKLPVKFEGKLGNACEGKTDIRVIMRALPDEVKVGNPCNYRALQQTIRNLQSLDLFANAYINQNRDEITGTMAPEIVLQEKEQQWAEVSTDWNIVPGRNSLPTLASIKPGATISFEQKNIAGLNRSFGGSIRLGNLFDPEDDLNFNVEYKHPYVDGIDNPRNRNLHVTSFNCKKLSPVFRGGNGYDDFSPIWVDRVGAKATITENYTRNSKFSYGLVMEEIRTRDQDGHIVSRGDIITPLGTVRGGGPPTTLSGNGIDRMVFAQANLTRDNTKFVNGTIVGDRQILQVDQGFGIGTNNAVFNRHKISATSFLPLMKVKEGKGKAGPPTLVLHGSYGGCVGDLPNHEAFTIGGPHSVRGYDMGEIGASRYKLELAAEVRVPVKDNAFVYAFAEHGNDLGSSGEVRGNPTRTYMRPGQGSSYGAGIKIGQMRAEYVVDHNAGQGGFFFNFGDRF